MSNDNSISSDAISSDDSSSESDEYENEFIMLLLREIPKEDRTPKEVYKIFMKKVISFMNKLNSYKDDPLFTRIRNAIEDMEGDSLNIESDSIIRCAVHQNKHLVMNQIEKYLNEEDMDTEADGSDADDDSVDDGSNQSVIMEGINQPNSHRSKFDVMI